MEKNKLKISLSIFLVVILVIAVLFFLNVQRAEKVRAGAGHNVFGWAWSENIGWISFNSTNCDANGDGLSDGVPSGCPPAGTSMTNYGVKIGSDGIFSDYAWSENIGWISFAPSGPYPAAPNFSARVDLDGTVCGAPKQVCGWARALAPVGNPQAGGWDGWIKLDYGVEINDVTHEFEGWAWDGDDSDSTAVIGWISFNHLNCDANGDGVSDQENYSQCPIGQAVADYKVETSFTFNQSPDKPQPVGEGEIWYHCWVSPQVALGTSIILNWTYFDSDGDLQQSYEIWVDENSGFSGLKFNNVVEENSISYTLNLNEDEEGDWLSELAWSTTYWWKVRVKDTGSGQWSEWSDSNPFTMNDHANPYPDFIWSPSPPSVDEVVQFCAVQEPGVCLEDKSTCYNSSGVIPSPSCSGSGKSFLWSFSPDTVEYATGTSPTSENPRVKFLTQEFYTATLQITDDVGTCPITKDIGVTFPLPEWEEAAP